MRRRIKSACAYAYAHVCTLPSPLTGGRLGMQAASPFSAREFRADNPRVLIQRLDRKIDACRRELRRRETIDLSDYVSWGNAWDRHPDLRCRERNLFWLRGEFQIHRNRQDTAR